MFEKEEEMLKDYKKEFEEISVSPEALDGAILSGFQKAKSEQKRKTYKMRWAIILATAAILLIGFFTSIRLSPAFADYISTIPGMEKIVELIRHDKGMLTAIEHDYYQEINASQEKNGLQVVIDGAIADENGLVLFYTLHAEEKQRNLTIDEGSLTSANGEKLNFSSYSYGFPHTSEKGEKSFSGTMEYYFQEPYKTREFEIDVKVKGDSYNEEYTIPFTLTKQLQAKKKFDLNKTIVIEGQKITIVDATIYPLRVAIHVKMDPNNSKTLLDFEDLRLVDEHGEAWTKINNGITASNISDNEKILYLQSNYFREPEKLFLVLNKIQAVDEDESIVVVNTETLEILKQPKGNKLRDMKIEGNAIWFNLHTEKEFPYFIFSEIKGGDGKVLESNGSYSHGFDENGLTKIGVNIQELRNQKNPISLKLSFYPEWIEGEGKIRIK